MIRRCTYSLVVLALALPGLVRAEDNAPFGTIRSPGLDQAKAQTLAWLKEIKADAATVARVEAIWDAKSDRVALDRFEDTLLLADPEAQKLIASAKNGNVPAPLAVPDLLKDTKKPAFYRSNLALDYARHLATRKVYEQALDTLKAIKPEEVVDPASYYFYKAVCENKLENKADGLATVDRLLNSVPDAPERYVVVAKMMKIEMQAWKDKDLKWASRRMDNIAGRLDIARGGEKTQKWEKEVIDLLEELIKKAEDEQNGGGGGGGGSGNQNNTARPAGPAGDSYNGGVSGPGNIDPKKLAKTAELWGKLPEKDRIRALEAISREYPPHYREAVEEYLRKNARATGDK